MAALGGADRPRAADVVGLGHQRVVLAFALRRTDGMDGRKIQHVETHCGDRRQPGHDILERAMAAGHRCAGARKQLVPAAEAGLFAVGHQWQFDRMHQFDSRRSGGCASSASVSSSASALSARGLAARRPAMRLQTLGPGGQRLAIGTACALRRRRSPARRPARQCGCRRRRPGAPSRGATTRTGRPRRRRCSDSVRPPAARSWRSRHRCPAASSAPHARCPVVVAAPAQHAHATHRGRR